MENIAVYLIVTVILILVSLRKSKKQKQMRSTQPTKPSVTSHPGYSQGDSIEDIFKRLGGDFFDDAEIQPVDELMAEPPTVKHNKPFLDFELKNKSTSKFKRTTSKSIFRTEEETQAEEEQEVLLNDEQFGNELNTVQDWRRAFIYSEIFHRKY